MIRSATRFLVLLSACLMVFGMAQSAVAAPDEDSFAYAVTTVARADTPTLPPNRLLPPNPILPFEHRGAYVMTVATTLPPNPIKGNRIGDG